MILALTLAFAVFATTNLASQDANARAALSSVAPAVKPDSAVRITLRRGGCEGTCPAYQVTLKTSEVTFEADSSVVAPGTHRDDLNPSAVRDLASRFVQAGFYSMAPQYIRGVADCQVYVVSIEIDGRSRQVVDHIGIWPGKPPALSDLEDQVDALARTSRWLEGADGLVSSLQREHFDFHSLAARSMLKAAVQRGQAGTVTQFLEAGVPLATSASARPGLLNAAATGFQRAVPPAATTRTLSVLIAAGASKSDPRDKDLALATAARSGNLGAVRALLAYGASPNTRDRDGKTALFAAAESYRASTELIRVLIAAGADIHARDRNGNTPLHTTLGAELIKELLALGADVNARNNRGENPLFTVPDPSAIPLLLEHGADPTFRNNTGRTALEAAAAQHNAPRAEALRHALPHVTAH